MTEDAFRALIGRHRGALARVVRHYEAAPEARRDLEQDVLVALWRAQESFRGESSERTWVLRIAHNVAATHVARAIRTKRVGERVPAAVDVGTSFPEGAAPPDEVVDAREAVRRVEERLRALDLPSRQLVLLALEGCSTAEIAEVTGLTPTNVTTKLSRLRKALAGARDESLANEVEAS